MTMDGMQETRRAMERAIRRLNALEYVILAVALVLAMAGGALVALLLSASLELAFRPVWLVSSLLLFLVPGFIALRREARNASGRRIKDKPTSTDDTDGR
jgi:hypothetical protein